MKHLDRKVVVDKWIELAVAAQSLVMFNQLQVKLDMFLQSLIENHDTSASSNDGKIADCIVALLSAYALV